LPDEIILLKILLERRDTVLMSSYGCYQEDKDFVEFVDTLRLLVMNRKPLHREEIENMKKLLG